VFFFAGAGSSLGAAQANVVKVRGAASMVSVGQKVAAFYLSEYPELAVDVNVTESVQGLPKGNAILWQTVGRNSAIQNNNLRDRFGSTPEQLPIGIEGVLVILNKDNPVADLSVEQLRSIYTGKIDNWKQVGGPDLKIRLYSTESVVGGSMFFQDFVLHGEDIDTTMRGYVNPKETAAAVAEDMAGIGLTRGR
jgi:phosphate transport system substrate-binding protein